MVNNGITNPDTIKYLVKIVEQDFEGPLDLLLHLVKTSEINIYDISISEITNQYLEYLKILMEFDLNNIAEFVEMATNLILIKTRAMLPIEISYENSEELKTDLINKLLEYQKYKIAAEMLEERIEDSVPFIESRSEVMLFDEEDIGEVNWKPLTVVDLVSSFSKILNKKRVTDDSFEVTMLNFSVEEKIDQIMQKFDGKEHFNYFDLIYDSMSRIELVCLFLAILELVKKGAVSIMQHIIFGDIHIHKVADYIPHEEKIPQIN